MNKTWYSTALQRSIASIHWHRFVPVDVSRHPLAAKTSIFFFRGTICLPTFARDCTHLCAHWTYAGYQQSLHFSFLDWCDKSHRGCIADLTNLIKFGAALARKTISPLPFSIKIRAPKVKLQLIQGSSAVIFASQWPMTFNFSLFRWSKCKYPRTNDAWLSTESQAKVN